MRSFNRASHWRRTGAEFGVEMGFLREVRSFYMSLNLRGMVINDCIEQ